MVLTENKPIPFNVFIKVMNSICKIQIESEGKISFGYGFFIKLSDSLKYLFTNYHFLKQPLMINNITLITKNEKKMNLKFDNRFVFHEPKKDISVIEIKVTDEIYNDIEFLDFDNYDKNYLKSEYLIYKYADVFGIMGFGETQVCSTGRILNINGYEFFHNISIDEYSYGFPIILWTNNINSIKVIGIHSRQREDKDKEVNSGIFIGEIIKEINILNNVSNSNKLQSSEKNKILINTNHNNDLITNKNSINIINSYNPNGNLTNINLTNNLINNNSYQFSNTNIILNNINNNNYNNNINNINNQKMYTNEPEEDYNNQYKEPLYPKNNIRNTNNINNDINDNKKIKASDEESSFSFFSTFSAFKSQNSKKICFHILLCLIVICLALGLIYLYRIFSEQINDFFYRVFNRLTHPGEIVSASFEFLRNYWFIIPIVLICLIIIISLIVVVLTFIINCFKILFNDIYSSLSSNNNLIIEVVH